MHGKLKFKPGTSDLKRFSEKVQVATFKDMSLAGKWTRLWRIAVHKWFLFLAGQAARHFSPCVGVSGITSRRLPCPTAPHGMKSALGGKNTSKKDLCGFFQQ